MGFASAQRLGFVDITRGQRRVAMFSLSSRWRAINTMDAAALMKEARLPRRPVIKPSPRLTELSLSRLTLR